MKKIAIISAILEDPSQSQEQFNRIVSEYKTIVIGRMGLPMEQADIGLIAIAVAGSMDEINAFTGQLGSIENVTVKTAVSKREI